MDSINYTTVGWTDFTSEVTHKRIIPLIFTIEHFNRNKLHQILNGKTICGPNFQFLPLSKELWKLEIGQKIDWNGCSCVSIGIRNVYECRSTALQFQISCTAETNQMLGNFMKETANVPENARYHELFAKDMNDFLKNVSCNYVCNITIQIEMDHNVVRQTCNIEDRSKLAANLESVLNEALFTDAILRSEGREIRAHRAILAATSAVFKSMFENQMTEKASGVVDISDVPYDTLHRLVTFLYSGRLDDLVVETASELFSASDKYAVQDLHETCSLFLKRSLTVENFLKILVLADAHSNEPLKSSAVAYFSEHYKEILRKPDWENVIKARPDISIDLLKVFALK